MHLREIYYKIMGWFYKTRPEVYIDTSMIDKASDYQETASAQPKAVITNQG